jgi:hypothetical protein
MGPETLANNMVPCHVRDLIAVFNGVIRTLAKAGGWSKGNGGGFPSLNRWLRRGSTKRARAAGV